MRLRSRASIRADSRTQEGAESGAECGAQSGAQSGAECGAVTAEFAIALPAVVGVLALCLSAVGAVSTHTLLTSLAVDSARGWARGESWGDVQSMVARRSPRATAVGIEMGASVAGDGGLGSGSGSGSGIAMGERCVTLSMPMTLGSWIELGVVIEESACAPIEP